jgi:aspartyl-tRNA(Asn)/glutamyl-tRNA(Gln) amidotransferase subunit B
MPEIASVTLKVGLEVHVELATRTKMFSRAANPAHRDHDAAPPNTLLDPTVLALPGALPVMNEAAIEMAMMVGLALGCSIAPTTKWDRKSYFYPDLPKSYQISQYDMPLCFDGAVDLPAIDATGALLPEDKVLPRRIGIIRAHLEEDAGKLLHEAPGGAPIDFSIVDLNRAGTPLLEVVTQPDFVSADEVVAFARLLRQICRFLGVTEGVMQKGHMRFEPNINTVITLADGRTVKTPIVEIKNLNSFKALKGAIEYEHAEQPRRWRADRREMGGGTKRTMGWDDVKNVTLLQRETEDAHDYRYFPDPDLLPVEIPGSRVEQVRARIGELPVPRMRRYMTDSGLTPKEAAAIIDDREVCEFYERTVAEMVSLSLSPERAGKQAANMLLQAGARRANERGVPASRLGISPSQVARIARLREDNLISSTAADELFGLLCEPGNDGADPATLAKARGLLTVRDDAALENWCRQAIADNPKVVADVTSGKIAAAGRLVGAAMKNSAGQGDAKSIRERILAILGVKE